MALPSGTRYHRLAGHWAAGRRRARRGAFAPCDTGHVRDRGAGHSAQRNQRSAGRNGCGQWGTRRNRSTGGKRKPARDGSAEWERRSHRRTGHVRDWGTCRRARRTCSTGSTGSGGTTRSGDPGAPAARLPARRLRPPIRTCMRRRPFSRGAATAAGLSASRGTAKSNASNNFDADSAEGCHRRPLSLAPGHCPPVNTVQSHRGRTSTTISFLIDPRSTRTTPHPSVSK